MQFINEIKSNFTNIINTVSFIDIIDIMIVSVIIYTLSVLLKNKRGSKIVKGMVFFFVLYLLASQSGLKTVSFLLGGVLQFAVVGIIVVFQPELRLIFEQMGNKGFIDKINIFKSEDDDIDKTTIRNSIIKIVNAAFIMSSNKTGALIVIEKDMILTDVIDSGTILNAALSSEILCNIFFHNAPLHDGAVIIRKNKIVSASCFLPLSNKHNIDKNLGTRHRASIGVTETSDSIVVVVSEETGKVSFVKSGNINYGVERNQLVNILNEELVKLKDSNNDKSQKNMLKNILKRNDKSKVDYKEEVDNEKK
ncbi:MAG: diadenylate cyclase CdaA [Oscillospiraceae bacterium]